MLYETLKWPQKRIREGGGADPDPLPLKNYGVQLLSLSYAPDFNDILNLKINWTLFK
jgi:hypothetical protein